MFKANVNKMLKKLQYQNQTNPGNKTTYQRPPRPRSTSFKTNKDYNRSKNKAIIREAIHDY